MGNQIEIIRYLYKVKEATKKELYENSTYSYYCNWEGNFQKVLSRLIKNGIIKKSGKFHYCLNNDGGNKTLV
jgi:hypothetical protein